MQNNQTTKARGDPNGGGKVSKEKQYIDACQNCKLPVSACKGTCSRKQILKNGGKQ